MSLCRRRIGYFFIRGFFPQIFYRCIWGRFQGIASNCLALSKLYRWRVNVESKLVIGKVHAVNSIFLISGTITLSHSIAKKMKHRYQSFTRIGRQFQSLERQVYADWTSVSFPLCQRSCLVWRTMANNDEYNDEYLCRDFFVGFNFWSRLSFQISEFRVHWVHVT